MGRIPEFRTGGVARTSQLVDVNQPLRDAQIIGRAVQNVAQAVDSGLQAADNVYVAKNEIKFKEKQIERRREFQEKFKEDPSNPLLLDEFKEQSQKDIDEFSSGLNRPQAKNAFNRMAQNQSLRTTDQLKTFQIQQTQDNVLTANLESMEAIKNISVQEPGVASALDSLKQVDMLKVSNQGPLGAKNSQRLFLQQQRKVADNFVNANLVNGDIGGVEKLIKEKRVQEALGPDGLLSARRKIDTLKRQREQRQKKLKVLSKKNPWSYLQKVGETKNMEMLNFANPMSFINRKDFVEEMSQKHDLDMKGIPISPMEIQGMRNTIVNANDRDLTGFLFNIDRNVDDETKSEYAAQLFPKEPMLGAAMHLAGEAPQESIKVLKGFRRINARRDSKGVKINTASMEKEIQNQLGNIIQDPDKIRLMSEAIKGHVVESVFSENGDLTQDVSNPDRVSDSILKVIGPIIKPSTVNTPGGGLGSFRNADGKFLEEYEVDNVLETLTPEFFKESGFNAPIVDVNGERKVLDFDKFGDRVRLQTIGDGKYLVLDDESGLPLESQDSTDEYILDLKSIYNWQQENETLPEPQEPVLKRNRLGAGLR